MDLPDMLLRCKFRESAGWSGGFTSTVKAVVDWILPWCQLLRDV